MTVSSLADFSAASVSADRVLSVSPRRPPNGAGRRRGQERGCHCGRLFSERRAWGARKGPTAPRRGGRAGPDLMGGPVRTQRLPPPLRLAAGAHHVQLGNVKQLSRQTGPPQPQNEGAPPAPRAASAGRSHLHAPLLAQGCPRRRDGGPIPGRAEDTGGRGASEGRLLRDAFERGCGEGDARQGPGGDGSRDGSSPAPSPFSTVCPERVELVRSMPCRKGPAAPAPQTRWLHKAGGGDTPRGRQPCASGARACPLLWPSARALGRPARKSEALAPTTSQPTHDILAKSTEHGGHVGSPHCSGVALRLPKPRPTSV